MKRVKRIDGFFTPFTHFAHFLPFPPQFVQYRACIYPKNLYNLPAMPRGKRTVFGVYCNDPACPNTGSRLGTMRFHKQDKMGVSWKEHVADMKKYCPFVRKQVPVKLKEEKHSSN